MDRIAILVHEQDSTKRTDYFLFEIAKVWRKQGFQLTVLDGTKPYIDADLAILHVDLSIVPDEYLAFIQQYPVVLNAQVKDISKRFISQHQVHSVDDYSGPAIVKTNLNCGGSNEARLAKKRSLVSKCKRRIRKRWNRFYGISPAGPYYNVYESTRDIPARIWKNPELIVEKFLPERKDDFYCLRTWTFLGNKETNSICYSNHPVIKSNNIVHRESITEVPETLRQCRRKLGFDFGKFDYVIVDNQVVLYDANRTPSLGDFSPEILMPGIRTLADGIRIYI